MHTLFDFLTFTKGSTYLVVAVFLIAFIPFWLFLTERQEKQSTVRAKKK